MRPIKTTLFIGAIAMLPVRIFAQFGLEENAPAQAARYFAQATQHHDASEFTQALADYREALSHQPSMLDAWYNLAIVQLHMGDFRGAERTLDTFFQIEPMDAGAHALYGLALFRQGHFDRAVAAFNFSLSENPSKDLYLARGLALYGSGQFHLASLDFDQVLASDPGHLRACQAKAALLLESGKYHLAIRYCNRILDRMPNDVAALTTRAVCRHRQGAKIRAMADFELALSDGHQSEVYLARANCRLADGDLPATLDDLRTALRLDPMNPETYALLAEAERADERPGAALESIEVAIGLRPNFAPYHLLKSQVASENSAFGLAVEEVYLALHNGLPDEEGKAVLRQIYRRMDAERANFMENVD